MVDERVPAEVWLAWRERHEARLRPLVDGVVARRSRGQSNPIEDFVIEYYGIRPRRLLRWSPGIGVVLEGRETEEYEGRAGWLVSGERAWVAPGRFPPRRRASVAWLAHLLAAIGSRPAFLGCHGMHEWAMVYRSAERRHLDLPLRLSSGEIAAVLEEHGLVCTHFDATRFFTEAARPLQRFEPTRERMVELEQPGCLHANMDLFRWAWKLFPWTSSELVRDALDLALRIRVLDMRASPYDLRRYGFAPIAVETVEGRSRYREGQQRFESEAIPIRRRLLEVVEDLRRRWVGGRGENETREAGLGDNRLRLIEAT